MRRPSTHAEAYDFWTRWIAGEPVARIEQAAEAGFYAVRMVKGGPFVPVEIALVQDTDPETGELTEPERFSVKVNGAEKPESWLDRQWTYCRPITAEHYEALMNSHQRDEHMAATHVRIDPRQTPVIRRPR